MDDENDIKGALDAIASSKMSNLGSDGSLSNGKEDGFGYPGKLADTKLEKAYIGLILLDIQGNLQTQNWKRHI